MNQDEMKTLLQTLHAELAAKPQVTRPHEKHCRRWTPTSSGCWLRPMTRPRITDCP